MNPRKSLYDITSFYDKWAVLKASYEGMRYQVERAGSEEESVLKVSIWPEPFCYEKTPKEQMQIKEFAYSTEGLDEVYDWLCASYTERQEYWEHARDFPFEGIL